MRSAEGFEQTAPEAVGSPAFLRAEDSASV
jgi:hypothetical protein